MKLWRLHFTSFFGENMSTTKLDILAPFEIWEVQLGSSTIKFHEPLVLVPHWLEDDPDDPDDPPFEGKKHIGVEYSKLNISASGRNRRELWECILGDIRSNWTEYVNEADHNLAPRAQAYKKSYLTVAEEVHG